MPVEPRFGPKVLPRHPELIQSRGFTVQAHLKRFTWAALPGRRRMLGLLVWVCLGLGLGSGGTLAARGAVKASGDWTGIWATQWREGGAKLELRQEGTVVTGVYPLYRGSVRGEVEGRALRGRWSEESGRGGAFTFALAADGRSFMGRFDSGEWWTGRRMEGAELAEGQRQVLASPREAMRVFLRAANATREGSLDEMGTGLGALDFDGMEGLPTLPGERIRYARRLFEVLDELTFSLWRLPEAAAPGENRVTAVLAQSGSTNRMGIGFVLREGQWRIEPPSSEVLESTLRRLRAQRGGRARTLHEHLALRSPRDTLRTFLEGMHRFDEGGRTNVFRTLSLEDLGPAFAERDEALLAHYLKHVLDRIGFVTYQEISDDPGQVEAYVHFRHPEGDVVLAPSPDGEGGQRWRFTAATLHRIRRLYAAIEEMPEVAGLRGTGPEPTFFMARGMLRRRAPFLLRSLGPLEGWQWLAFVPFLAISLVVAWGMGTAVLWALRRRRSWAAALSSERAQAELLWPVRLGWFGGLWYVGSVGLALPERWAAGLRSTALSLAIVAVVWLAYVSLGLAAAYGRRKVGVAGRQAVLTSLVSGMLRLAVVLGGILWLADVWAIRYTSVLAGVGVGGLAVALAAQQTLQNVIAGFTLFADSPLSVGDFCRYGDKLGTVEEIGLRSTRIRSLDRSVVSVPNSEFANLQLENFAKRDRVLLRTTLQLRYETTPDQLRYVLAELRRLLVGHPRVHPDPARVRLVGMGACSLDVEVFAYVVTVDYGEFLAIREDVFLRMMEIVLRSGTGFAFPSQVNYLAHDPGLDPAATRAAEAAVAQWRQSERLPFPDLPPGEIRQLDGRLDYPPKGSPAAAGEAPRSA